MYKLGNIMIVKFKIFQFKKMLNVFQATGNQVIHSNDMITIIYEAITKV